MRKWFCCIFLLSLFFKTSVAQQSLKVLLYNDIKVSKAYFTFTGNEYLVEADNTQFSTLSLTDTFHLKENNGKIEIRTAQGILGNFKKITLTSQHHKSLIRLQPLPILRIYNDYPGKIEISSHAAKLRFVNHVAMEDYLTGVLKGEAGLDKPVEMYKVHAVISRTYALKNRSKHRVDGLNVCDQVHCQVYKGYWGHYEDIFEGVKQTEGEVIYDEQNQLIDALFHSNCGGQTLNSEDVWTNKLNYCRSKPDSFCFYMKNADWVKEFKTTDFTDYLNKSFNVSKSIFQSSDTLYHYQSEKRNNHWKLENKNISFKQMRADLELKSAYFDVYQMGDKIQLIGKGFGHGVGLCQEGAICMAEYGYSYEQIIKHFYEGVFIKKR